MDYASDVCSFFGNQVELGATWGYAEMNVSAGLVALGNYGLGVGGFHYSGRGATGADVVGVLNVSGGAVDVNAASFSGMKNRVRGLLLGEGWYDKKTATSDNLFTGYVNLSGGAISNRYGAVILGAGAAKGVWTQTGGEFANVSAQAPSSADAATGLLSLQGGAFATAGDVVVGQDGNGTIEMGPRGSLNARALTLTTADATESSPAHSSTLKFKASASGVGRIALTGALTVGNGAKLEVDLSDWDKEAKLRLVSCADMVGAFDFDDDVTIVGMEKSAFGGKYKFVQVASGITLYHNAGTVLTIR